MPKISCDYHTVWHGGEKKVSSDDNFFAFQVCFSLLSVCTKRLRGSLCHWHIHIIIISSPMNSWTHELHSYNENQEMVCFNMFQYIYDKYVCFALFFASSFCCLLLKGIFLKKKLHFSFVYLFVCWGESTCEMEEFQSFKRQQICFFLFLSNIHSQHHLNTHIHTKYTHTHTLQSSNKKKKKIRTVY